MQYISLGCNCQVSHQIRRVHGQQGSRVFDWVVTSRGALDRWFRSDINNLFERVSLSSNLKYVSDYFTGLQFYPHDLPNIDGKISPDWQDALPQVKEKYQRRSQRTRELLASGQPITLVRRVTDNETATIDQHTALLANVRTAFPAGDFRLIMVGLKAEPVEGMVFQIRSGPDWTGDNETWDRALATVMTAAG